MRLSIRLSCASESSDAGGTEAEKRNLRLTVSRDQPAFRLSSGAIANFVDPAPMPTDHAADRLKISRPRFEYQPRDVRRVPAIVFVLPADGHASDWRRSISRLTISHAWPCTHSNRRIFKLIRRTRRFVYPVVYPGAIFRTIPGRRISRKFLLHRHDDGSAPLRCLLSAVKRT
jgi:hypothetical protein